MVVMLLVLLQPSEGRRNTHSVRRQDGKNPRHLVANPAGEGEGALILHPPTLETPIEKEMLWFYNHKYETDNKLSEDPGPSNNDEDDDDDAGGNAPFDGDDEATDSVLAISLLCLCLWIGLSAMLVAAFVQQEKRRELMLRFWSAIDTHPDLRRAVEHAAGGTPFPKAPRHTGLHRFLRATAVALTVTVGLNIVLFVSRPPVPPGSDATAEGGDNAGGDNLPLDPTADDGTGTAPVLGVVFVLLFVASLLLIARGIHAACCASRQRASNSSSSHQQDTASSYPGNGSGTYEPVNPTVTPYIPMHGGSSTPPPGQAYYVGVPIAPLAPSAATAPSLQQEVGGGGGGGGGGEEEESAPPPYSAALAAATNTATVV